MRRRGIAVPLLTVLLAAPLLGASPTAAVPVDVGQHTIFDTRVAGMPTTAEAWRTLRSVSAETDWRTGEVLATATFATALPPSASASVTWHLGRWSDTGQECVPGKTLTSTVTGDGHLASTSVAATYADLARDYACLDVVLTQGGTVTDRMRDRFMTREVLSGAEADLAAESRGEPTVTRVVAGRPTKALLLVTSHVLASSSTRVTASGPVALEPVTVSGLAADEVRPVVARLTAPRKGRFTMDLQARDERGDADYDGTARVRAVPAAGRPDAGRYTDGDGVTFRVDRAGRVGDLVAAGATSCDGGRSPRIRMAEVMRLPRTGASAAVRRIGKGWSAVQLTTLDERRITGVVVRSVPGCLSSASFTVRRAR